MTATKETFDVDNPAHLEAAQDMAAAMASLNALPWPSGRACFPILAVVSEGAPFSRSREKVARRSRVG